jgi:hypothetical protein
VNGILINCHAVSFASLSKFEDQYLEMGERYKEMGETLAELKVKIDANRDKTEQGIRNELLQVVQKTIVSSFPKK